MEQSYRAAKTSLVFMDNSGMGQLLVSGADHVDLLHRMTTNELRKLTPGQSQYNIFTNEKGRIVDRVRLLKLDAAMHLTTSNASNQRVSKWIEKFVFLEDVKVEDRSDDLVMLTFFGPGAGTFLDTVFTGGIDSLADDAFLSLQDGITIVRNSFPGLPFFDVLIPERVFSDLADKINAEGSRRDLLFAGSELYDVLRIEAGWPIFPVDFNEDMNPHEANMLSFINFDKGCYIGQEVVARLDTYEKVQRRMMGIHLQQAAGHDGIPVVADGKEVGNLTSSAYSPGIGGHIALAIVKTKFADTGKTVEVDDMGKRIKGGLVELPFDSS